MRDIPRFSFPPTLPLPCIFWEKSPNPPHPPPQTPFIYRGVEGWRVFRKTFFVQKCGIDMSLNA